ncbi:unnamed protein product, partial [Ectocarpus sp. 12 AP-2014]
MRPAPSKLEAIANMPRSRTVEDLRTFLGLTGYLRQFVTQYSVIAAPLTDILHRALRADKSCGIRGGEIIGKRVVYVRGGGTNGTRHLAI